MSRDPVWLFDTPDLYWIPARARIAREIRAGKPVAAAWEQQHVQVFADDAGEATSTALAAKNATYDVDVDSGDVILQLRFSIAQTEATYNGGPFLFACLLYVDVNGGGFNQLGSAGQGGVYTGDSAYLTTAGDTTERLAGSYSFITDNNWQVDNGLASSNCTFPNEATAEAEVVWAVRIDAAEVSDNDTFTFRIYEFNDGAADFTYTNDLVLTISKTTPKLEVTGWRWRHDNGSESAAEWVLAAQTDPAPSITQKQDVATNTTSYGFGTTAIPKRAVQFTMSANERIFYIAALLSKVNTPTDDVTIEVWSDSGGLPGAKLFELDNIDGAVMQATVAVERSQSGYHYVFASGTYWFVFGRTGSTDDTNYFNLWGDTSAGTTGATYNGATWTAAANDDGRVLVYYASVPLSVGGVVAGAGYRLRALIKEVNGAAYSGFTPKLYVGTTPVSSSSNAARSYGSTNVTDGAATTQQIGSGSFTAGIITETNNTSNDTINVPANGETEVEFTVYPYLSSLLDLAAIDSFVIRDGTTVVDFASALGGAVPQWTPMRERRTLKYFRFRNDDGSEAAATWKAATNATTTIPLDTNFRVRFGLQSDEAYLRNPLWVQVWYSVDGGAWTSLSASSNPLKYSLSSYLTDDEDTTQQITTGGDYAPDNELVRETAQSTFGYTENDVYDKATEGDRKLDFGGYVEVEVCIQADSTYLSGGEEIEFQLRTPLAAASGVLTVATAETGLYVWNTVRPYFTVSASTTVQGSGTATGSADASATADVTHNADGTATGSADASATATLYLPTSSATVTGSADASATATVTIRASATATGSADASATATVTHDADATVTGSADATATATVTHNADAAVTGSAEATGTGRLIIGGNGTATGNAFASAFAAVTHNAIAIAAGAAFLVAVPTVTHNAQASVIGSADANATATVTYRSPGTATGTAYVSATADVTHNAAATATGKAYAEGTAVGETAHATVTGRAYTVAVSSASHVGSGSCTGTAYATATADVTHRAPGTATGSAEATGTASVTHGASASVTGAASALATTSVTHAGVGTATGTAYASATGAVSLSGSATATGSADATGTATVTHNAVGTATGQASVVAVGSVQGQTGSATVTGRAYASATATVEHDFSATATGKAYASGTLTAGDFSASATVTGRAFAWAGQLAGYGYIAYLDDGTYFRLARYSPTTGGLDVIATVAYEHEPGVYYNIVLNADGNTLQAKVWSDDETEPVSWMIEETVGDYASGAPGIAALSTTEVLFDVFSTGIGGDPYPLGRFPQAVEWLLPVPPVYIATEDPYVDLAWTEAETTGDVLGGQIRYELEYQREGDTAWTSLWRGYEREYEWNMSNLVAGSYCVRVRPYAGCEYGPWSELCGIEFGGRAPVFESPDGYYFGDDNVGQPDHGMWIRLFQASHKDDEFPVNSCLVSRELIPAGVGGECLFQKLYVTTTFTTQAEMQVTPILDGKVLTEETRIISLIPGGGGRTVDRFEVDLSRNYESATAERFRYGMRGTYFQVKICVVDISGTGRVEIDGVSLKYLINRETHPWARPFAGELEVDVEMDAEGGYYLGTESDDVPAALYELKGERDFGLPLSPVIQPRQVAPFGTSEEAWFRSLYLCVTRSNTSDYRIQVVPVLDGIELGAESVTLAAVTQPKTEVIEIPLSRPYDRSDIEQSRYGLRGVWFSFRVAGDSQRPPGEVCFDGAAIEAIPCRETEASS